MISRSMSDLVDKFAEEMKLKLEAAIDKYGYYNDPWMDDEWEAEWREALMQHIEKGDLIDIANYCAFGLYHGWKI